MSKIAEYEMVNNIKYDVALSFAREDMEYVNQVATHLSSKGVKCFYDQYEQKDLWGKDLYQHLHAVYSQMSKYTVIFISKYYASKVWTNHELRSAQSRAINESREYILPVRFDDTELPGLNSNIGYVKGSDLTPTQLADMIVAKLGIESKEAIHSPIRYSYLIIKRDTEEKRRHRALYGFLLFDDLWHYSDPIKVYLDGDHVGDVQNGGDLYVETTPGNHLLLAKCSQSVVTGSDNTYVHTTNAESPVFKINARDGKNTFRVVYREGHAEQYSNGRVNDGTSNEMITPFYFVEE